jgi:hypothetical protein
MVGIFKSSRMPHSVSECRGTNIKVVGGAVPVEWYSWHVQFPVSHDPDPRNRNRRHLGAPRPARCAEPSRNAIALHAQLPAIFRYTQLSGFLRVLDNQRDLRVNKTITQPVHEVSDEAFDNMSRAFASNFEQTTAATATEGMI